jgi:hypothetical protein
VSARPQTPQEVVAEPLTGTLRNSGAFLHMRFGGVLLGNDSKSGDVLTDTNALTRAKTFFTHEPRPAHFAYEQESPASV